MIKYIFSDLDGTLLNQAGQLRKRYRNGQNKPATNLISFSPFTTRNAGDGWTTRTDNPTSCF